MTLLVGSCWFFLATSLIFLINFITWRLSRTRIGGTDQRDDDKTLETQTRSKSELPDDGRSDITNLNSTLEDELSGFIFKFEHQISDHGFVGKEESSLPSQEESETNSTTRIHNYRVSDGKNFSRLVVEPEFETFLVKESFVHPESSCSDDKEVHAELGPNFLSDKDQKQQQVDDVKSTAADISNEDPVNTDDTSLPVEILEVKNLLDSDADAFDKIKKENGVIQSVNIAGPESSKMINDVSLNQDDCLSDSEQSKKEYPIENKTEPLCDILEENVTRFSAGDSSSSNVGSEFHDETDDYSMKDPGVEFDDREDMNRKISTSILSSKDSKQEIVDVSEPEKIDITNKKLITGDERLMYSKQLEQENFYTSSLEQFRNEDERARFLSEKLSGFNSDSESLISESDGYSVKDLIVDSDGFLSERDFDGCEQDSATLGDHSAHNSEFKVEPSDFLHGHPVKSDLSHDFNSADIYLDEHLPEIDSYSHGLQQRELPNEVAETSKVQNFGAEPSSKAMHIDFTDSSDDEFYSGNLVHGFGKSVHEETDLDDLPDQGVAGMHSFDYRSPNFSKSILGASTSALSSPTNAESPESEHDYTHEESEEVENSEEAHLDDLDEEDFDELDSLWEHEDLIEQLKMELKRVRATALPTILEESETPKTVEDLKSWKIDDKLLHEDPMDELHKFYKSYRERMRKLDILNYQKMYAVGFLQLKDPLQSVVGQKPIIPTLTSILSSNLWTIRGKSSNNESNKFIKELHCELELVYVAQTCLSWEFLRWQYEKARDLPESDSYVNNQYNQVAGDFQQFQVILQRFLENETFQGPRLPNYVKTRCVLRNLIQVPVIREDSLKDKMEDQRKGNLVVTNEVLEDIMEESIRLFWEFVKADKDESRGILKALRATYVELEDPSFLQLMLDIQSDLQKKKKKIKDILRTGNCLVKKFKKPKEDRSNQDLFFSQVDLKLVERVLRMSRITTDQLMWCHKKLNKIMIVDRKVYREPSFLVFPF